MSIRIGHRDLTLKDFEDIVINGKEVEISAEALIRVEESFSFLQAFSKDKIIYGINTGFGPMAQYKIEDSEIKQLQFNLIRSHSSGSGEFIDEVYVRALMLARLNTLCLGFSGIHKSAVKQLETFINLGIYPLIPEHGGVGASGDLVQLSHLALGLIGEGEARYKGNIMPMADIFKFLNLKPIEIHVREGLGLINGTSVMTGIGIVNSINARKLYHWAVFSSSMINQLVESYDDHFSEPLNEVKKHPGQNQVALLMRNMLKGSKLLNHREEKLFNGNGNHQAIFLEKVQEYYSLRCVPQILGPILENIDNSLQVLMNEINSVNDNPIIDSKRKNVFHGGNFHGDYVSFEMDKLKIATTKLSMLIERQLNFLMNNKLNNILPPFVNLGKLGLNLGMQGVQFTATSTVAENQTLSFPMYVHSIPNNNDNQDIVSMGTNSALMCARVIRNTYEVLSIHLISILQAVDYLKFTDKLSEYTKLRYIEMRKIVPMFVEDSIKYPEIKRMKQYLIENPLKVF